MYNTNINIKQINIKQGIMKMTVTKEDKTLIQKKTDLMNSEEFNKALEDAANIKKDTLTSCKDRNKTNYSRFFDIMVTSNREIQNILDIKKRNRTDEQNNKYKAFKKEVSGMYKQICDLITPEELEEGELSKIQKLVYKVASIVKMMMYIGHNEIEDEFNKYGIGLNYEKLEKNDVFQNEAIKENILDVFKVGQSIKENINSNKEEIETNIYTQNVPVDLQFDKQMNPIGIKVSDFSKLVALKTKILMANSDEAKEKVGEVAENTAAQYVFQNNRNDIMNKKILDLIPDMSD